MMKTCEGCSKLYKDGSGLICAKCNKNYHVKCLNMATAQYNRLKHKSSWNCPACPVKDGRHDDTPVKSSVDATEESSSSANSEMQEISADPQNCDTPTPTHTILSSPIGDCQPSDLSQNALLHNISLQISQLQMQMSSIQIIKNDLCSLKTDISELKNSLSAKVEDLENRMSDAELKLSQMSDLQSEVDELKSKVASMMESNLKNDQWVRRSNIQINGIPSRKDEDLIKVIKDLADMSGYSLDTSRDIDFVTRIAIRNDVDTSYPKPIILKLLSRYKKDDFLSCLRRLKDLKASDVGFPGNQARIYINDHLSSYNKMLLQKAKALAKEKKYDYCWVRNCTVMVRQNEKSKIIHITSEESLKKIV
ncbi:uncharacterized protein [Maniola hyperantus]|uniref:uncharacterized protein n=2 Tax=Aphantopus hyperantus TaxID=2795564 RepID=UPI003747FA28